ncbi:MAG: S9 family peptidase [Sphaerobacter thermophilus]|uniref:S9 family peptidase n=1 Tax=Sphaerobacter thermophilus TaxID=2057 RepID=UPI00396E7D88
MMEARAVLTADDLLTLKSVNDAQIDPGGRRVAFVVAEASVDYQEPSPRSRIWLVDVAGGEPRQVSQGPGTDDLPRWSPDGETLAFRSDRKKRGTGQLYLLRSWAEPELLREFDAGISAIAWAPDGRTIAVIAPDAVGRNRPEGKDWVLFEEEHAFGRIWLVDVASGEARCLTTGPVHVWELAWSPDGSAIAAIVSDLPYAWSWYRARLVRIDVATGEVTTLYAPERQITGPVWSPDGRAIVLITSTWSDPGMSGGDVLVVPAAGGAAQPLTAGEPRSYLSLHWVADGRLFAAALERNRAAICLLDPTGAGRTQTLWAGERFFNVYGTGVDISADGRLVATGMSAPTEPVELWVGRIADQGPEGVRWARRSAVNADFPADLLSPYETLRWTAPDGMEIEGMLVRPRGAGNPPWPLVTLIHGGPTASWAYGLRPSGPGSWIHLLAARGCAVLLPNPRGSAGYGLAFAEANIGDLGGGDLQDILAGVDACVRDGIADPERLGVGGWSYGGYLTCWAITQTDRFRAAVAGASITNWYSFHGGTNIPGFDEIFLRDNPFTLDGRYATRSPIFYVDRVRTPTLFLHGEQDPCCPVGQAYEMTRGLRSRGVEAQCVVYPREPHGVREREHQRDVMERAVNWFVERLGVARPS